MTETINTAGITIMTVFFVCARVAPKQTAIVVAMILFFILLTPFLAGDL